MALDIITDLNVLGDIDLNKKELQNAVIQVLSTKPGSPATGQIFYDSDVNQVQVYTGSAWEGLVTETVDSTTITDVTSILNSSLVVGRDAHNQIQFTTDNEIHFKTNNETPVIKMKASGEVEATSLDISGDVDVDGTLETDAFSIGGTTVSSTAAELNVLDGITAVVGELNYLDLGSTAVGTAIASKAVVLDSNKDYTGFRNITLTGELDAGSLDVSGDADIDGTLETDALTIGGTNILTGSIVTTLGTITQDTILFTSANADDPLLTVENTTNDTAGARILLLKDKGAAGADNDEVGEVIFAGDNDAQQQTNFVKLRGLISDASDGSEGGKFEVRVATHDGEMQPGLIIQDGDAEDELDVWIGNGSGSVTTIAGDLTVTGTTTTVNSTTVNLNDHNIVLDSGNSTSAVIDGAGITIEGGSGSDATFTYNTTGPKFEMKLGSSYEDLKVDGLIAASLDISGNVDVDGTLETDALSINGTTVSSTAAELNILDGVTATASELNIMDGVTSTTSELNILDGVTATAAEINIIDGNTSATSTTLADADRVIVNDAGTMKQVAMTDVATYTNGSIEGTGALNSGSITSGFGAIDNGTSGIRTDTFVAETSFVPDADDGATLGSANLNFSDLYLADGANIYMGDDQDVLITHDADKGVIMSHAATGDDKPFILTLKSNEATIADNEVIAGIEFIVDEDSGGDSDLVAAGIFAFSAGAFDSTNNRTDLVFTTGHSESAGTASGALDITQDMVLSSQGVLTVAGNITPAGIVLDGNTITGVDDSGEFTDDDAHIMTSAAINDKFGVIAGSSSIVTTGALNSGSITSGFGNIDNGSSTITTTGLISGGSLDIDDVLINGTTIGHTDDTDLMTVADGLLTVAGEISVTTLDIGGTNVTSTAAELNILDGVTTTTAEINLIDGGTSRTTNAVADGDGILHNNGGTMEMTKVETFATYFAAECAALREKVFVLNNSVSGVASSDNITYTVTHSLNTRNVMVEVIRNGANSGDYSTVLAEVKRNGDDTIQVVFASARTAGDYTVMIRAIG